MVRIPKFYCCREKIGTLERWLISGTRHPGFSVEPAFLRGGRELDCIYVGAYNIRDLGNGIFSSTGGFPDVAKSNKEFSHCITLRGTRLDSDIKKTMPIA